jgi:hypothetical protein
MKRNTVMVQGCVVSAVLVCLYRVFLQRRQTWEIFFKTHAVLQSEFLKREPNVILCYVNNVPRQCPLVLLIRIEWE